MFHFFQGNPRVFSPCIFGRLLHPRTPISGRRGGGRRRVPPLRVSHSKSNFTFWRPSTGFEGVWVFFKKNYFLETLPTRRQIMSDFFLKNHTCLSVYLFFFWGGICVCRISDLGELACISRIFTPCQENPLSSHLFSCEKKRIWNTSFLPPLKRRRRRRRQRMRTKKLKFLKTHRTCCSLPQMSEECDKT